MAVVAAAMQAARLPPQKRDKSRSPPTVVSSPASFRESPTTAKVEYTWKWNANDLGKKFDASSPVVKGFQAYDRSVLIQKYGVDFYNAPPIKETVRMSKKDGKWQLGE